MYLRGNLVYKVLQTRRAILYGGGFVFFYRETCHLLAGLHELFIQRDELIQGGSTAVILEGVAQPTLCVVIRQVQEIADVPAVKLELDLLGKISQPA